MVGPDKSIIQSDETIRTSWSERTFYLSNDVESRKIKQIQLTAWTEGELPPDDIQFHQFIRHVKGNTQFLIFVRISRFPD